MSNNAPINSDQALSLAYVADWLAQYFLQPPQEEQIRNLQSTAGRDAICHIGTTLNTPDLARSFNAILNAHSASQTAINMQRRHVELFEGIFNKRYLLPYASFWDGTGHLFGPAVERTRRLMTELDVSVSSDCVEPEDHIGIQLAVLAEAIRQDNSEIAYHIFAEMHDWTGIFIKALSQRDADGYYGHLAKLLAALLQQSATILFQITSKETALTM